MGAGSVAKRGEGSRWSSTLLAEEVQTEEKLAGWHHVKLLVSGL